MATAKDWAGPNYMKSYTDTRRLANKIKEFYRHSPFYDQIKLRVVHNPTTNDYYIRSNITELWPNVVDLEERVGL